jgi:hypothetical protein
VQCAAWFHGLALGLIAGKVRLFLTLNRLISQPTLASGAPASETPGVRKDAGHLPPTQQQELERVTQILMDEFSVAISRATQPWKKNGKIQNRAIRQLRPWGLGG